MAAACAGGRFECGGVCRCRDCANGDRAESAGGIEYRVRPERGDDRVSGRQCRRRRNHCRGWRHQERHGRESLRGYLRQPSAACSSWSAAGRRRRRRPGVRAVRSPGCTWCGRSARSSSMSADRFPPFCSDRARTAWRRPRPGRPRPKASSPSAEARSRSFSRSATSPAGPPISARATSRDSATRVECRTGSRLSLARREATSGRPNPPRTGAVLDIASTARSMPTCSPPSARSAGQSVHCGCTARWAPTIIARPSRRPRPSMSRPSSSTARRSLPRVAPRRSPLRPQVGDWCSAAASRSGWLAASRSTAKAPTPRSKANAREGEGAIDDHVIAVTFGVRVHIH